MKVNVRKRPDGHGWLVDYRWGPRRIRKTYPTQGDAADAKSAVLYNVRQYGHPSPSGVEGGDMTIEEITRAWWASAKLRGLRPDTLRSYRSHGLALINHWGHDRVTDLTRDGIEKWAQSMWAQGYSHGYPKSIIVALRCALKELGMDDPVTQSVRWPREDKGEVPHYTVEQAKAILDKAHPNFRGVVAVQLFTGIRPMECRRLRAEDIQREEKYILVKTGKTGRRVVQGMPDTVWTWLDKYPYQPANYKRHIAAIAKLIDFPWIQDGMRHTFCTYHVALHSNPGLTAGVSGHKTLTTLLDHYVGVTTKAEAERYFSLRPAPGPGTAACPSSGPPG